MAKASVLKETIKAKALTISGLEKKLGFSNGALRKSIERNSYLKNETIVKLVELFPDINENYLRRGDGELFLQEPHKPYSGVNEAIPVKLVDETEVTTSPTGMEFRDLDNGMVLITMALVDELAYASYPHGWKDPEYVVELPKFSTVLPRRERGFHRAFEVRGDSMNDGSLHSICNGDIVMGRLIPPEYWDQKLYLNRGTDYVIVTHEGVIVKRITDHDMKEGTITCSSINPDKNEFPDFTVRLR